MIPEAIAEHISAFPFRFLSGELQFSIACQAQIHTSFGFTEIGLISDNQYIFD